MKKLAILILAAIFVVGCSEEMITGSNQDVNVDNLAKKDKGNTIVDIAAGDENFSILVQAVVFADLVDVLDGNRQFTVFAPTNTAFENLLGALGWTPDDLLAPGNEELVRGILLYHVAPGERFASDVVSSERVRTMAKEFAFVDVSDGPKIGNEKYGYANIIGVDIDASNGVIHVLDAVILPPSLNL